jgi:hypothetical protein
LATRRHNQKRDVQHRQRLDNQNDQSRNKILFIALHHMPTNQSPKRTKIERAIHREVDAITQQLQQIRMEAKFRYVVAKASTKPTPPPRPPSPRPPTGRKRSSPPR